jgi:Zn-dependent metalloprotease
MKSRAILLLVFNFYISINCFSQYQHFLQYITPYLSSPVVSGFYYINPSNSFQPGYLYQQYRVNTPDFDNQMILIDYHVDSLVGYSHYKYQQLYKNIPVEGAGCIEHFNESNKLKYINAKLVDSIKQDTKPRFGPDEAINLLLEKLNSSGRTSFAWDSPEYEAQIQQDMNDSTATWYPDAELLFAVDTFKNMTMVISGDRYKLAYAIPITFLNPFETIIYHVDANNGSIIKVIQTSNSNGPATISIYGINTIDTEWQGGFNQNFLLRANDNGKAIHTRIANLDHAWWTLGNVTDDDDIWDPIQYKETTAHFFTTMAWDFYEDKFSRPGQDSNGIMVRVLSQYNSDNSFFTPGNSHFNYLKFGTSDLNGYLGSEPSIVAHEYTHGVIHHTSQLGNTYESGALNEAFCDIFGVVIQSLMLDQGSTDWVFGNEIATSNFNKRSLSAPKTLGTHLDNIGSNVLGQPDTYFGEYWQYDNQDSGGIHINSGVINKWFYLLTDGDSGINDNGDYYNISGIGMLKSINILYHAMTTGLISSSQFSDAREATIESSIELYGECSIEHQQTTDAWYAVGIGGLNNCNTTYTSENLNYDDYKIYPNPTSSEINFELPSCSKSIIKITNLSGEVLQKIETSDIYFSIQLESLQSGLYMVTIDNGRFIVTKKITLSK